MILRNILRITKHTSSISFARVNYSSSVLLAHNVHQPPNDDGAPPVLITHGLLGSRQNWNSIAKAVAKSANRKVITFDARNHGDSPHTKTFSYEVMSEDVLHLIKHLSLDQITLMGHSMGGRTSMAFALKYPQFIERLVVVDVSPSSINADFPTMKVFVEALRNLQKMYEGSNKPLSEIRKVAELALRAVVVDPAVRAFLLTNLSSKDGAILFKPNLQGLLDNFEEIAEFPLQLLEKTLDKSTLFIRGEKSSYIPVSDFPRIQKTFKAARLATVANAGHWPHSEKTVQFMEILLPFVRGEAD